MIENYKPIFLVDSNILVYAYDNTNQKKHMLARKLLEKCWKKEIHLVISAQNLAEFFVIVTKKVPNPLSIEQAEEIISDITTFSHWKTLHYSHKTLLDAITLYKKTKKHFWDGLIVATMLESNILNIYTENVKDFQNYPNLIVVNPFK